MPEYDWPSERAVAEALDCLNREAKKLEPENLPLDVRLRVTFTGWRMLSGSPDYDQDHRGLCGSTLLDGEPINSLLLARELLDQCRDQEFDSED